MHPAHRVLVIDNGAIGLATNGRAFVHKDTGQFVADLSAAGFQTSIVAPERQQTASDTISAYCLQDHALPFEALKTGGGLRKVQGISQLTRAIAASDFVYLFFPGTLAKIAAGICRLLGQPFGLYIRGSQFGTKSFDGAILRNASFVATVSPLIQERVQHLCQRAFAIRPMTELSTADLYIPEPLETPPAIWKLLYVGRVEEAKGINELIEAARTLQAKGIPFTLKMIGAGPLSSRLSEARTAGDLPSNIELAGPISNRSTVLEAYRNADLFVFPTYHEGFPRVLYEAMISSLPILTTMVGGIPGRMRAHENCIPLQEKSAQSIVDGVLSAIADPAALTRLAANGRTTVLEVLGNAEKHSVIATNEIRRVLARHRSPTANGLAA